MYYKNVTKHRLKFARSRTLKIPTLNLYSLYTFFALWTQASVTLPAKRPRPREDAIRAKLGSLSPVTGSVTPMKNDIMESPPRPGRVTLTRREFQNTEANICSISRICPSKCSAWKHWCKQRRMKSTHPEERLVTKGEITGRWSCSTSRKPAFRSD